MVCTGDEPLTPNLTPRYEQARVGSEETKMIVYTALIGAYEATAGTGGGGGAPVVGAWWLLHADPAGVRLRGVAGDAPG